MISAIVYGRNDNHGYGMAKRVAIGLNVLATQLDDGTGEILFVDYNTPDHLPTLPELIADTLTQQARKRLRVLRVRPRHHARFRRLSPLPVIESVARNVALRRSNPANRWVLSTNTDAMVVPNGGKRLIDAVAGLADGLYGLPRFELPERCWEGFDRLDPAGCAASARDWSDRCRLREVVRAVADVLFDNPGDFQLVPRAELFAIGGFEEEMLLGWHVDHNIARRLSFRLGAVRDLSGGFDLHHLGHSRNVVATHARDKIENDIARFVTALDSPQAMHPAGGWGLADEEIEEIRLDRTPGEQVLDACAAIMKPLGEERHEAAYLPKSFDTFDYDAGRATAHLLDLLSPCHPATRFAYCGGRRATLALLRDGLAALGFRGGLLVPQSSADRLDAAGLADVEVGADEAVLEEADVLIFEFGRDCGPEAGRQLSAEDEAALDSVAALLDRAVGIERRRAAGSPPRLFVAVNAVHTRFEAFVGERIAAGASPFTTRLRYGFATDLPAGGLDAHPEVVAHAWLLLRRLAEGASLSPLERLDVVAHAEPVRALLEDPPAGFEALRGDAALRGRLADILAPGPELAGMAGASVPALPPLSGPARGDAWNDRQWASVARSFSSVRNGWAWERAQLLRALSATLGGGEGRVLAVCNHPDPLVGALAARFPDLDVMDVRGLSGEAGAFEGAHSFTPQPLRGGGPRVVTPATAPRDAYAAIVLPHAVGFRGGVARIGEVMAPLADLLADQGTLLMAGEVSITGTGSAMRPSISIAGGDGFPALMERFFGLRLRDGDVPALRRGDLASVASRDLLDAGAPALGIAADGDVFWPWVWVFARSGEGSAPAAAEAVQAAFSDLLLGEQIGRLSVAAGAERQDGRIEVDAPPESGHFAYGPFLDLAPGSYQALFRFGGIAAPPHAPTERRVVAEVKVGEAIVAKETVRLRPGKHLRPLDLRLRFSIDPSRPGLVETRVWTNGHVELTLDSVSIARR